MNERSRILIAGCGYVGGAAAELLHEAGHTVFGIRRDLARLPAGVTPVAIDLLGADYRDLPTELDAVVWALSPSHDELGYREAYVEAPKRLLAHLKHRGDNVRRTVLVGSTSVWEHTAGADVTEETPTNPSNYRGASVLRGEQVFAESSFPSVSLRVAGIYGPERTRMLERVAGGIAQPPVQPVFGNRIWRDDVAKAIVHVLQLEQPDSLYIVVDDDPADIRDVYAWLAERLGVTLPAASDGYSGRGGNKRCRNTRLRGSGWQPSVASYRDGYALLMRDRSRPS